MKMRWWHDKSTFRDARSENSTKEKYDMWKERIKKLLKLRTIERKIENEQYCQLGNWTNEFMFLIFEREMCKKVKEWTDWEVWEMRNHIQ